MTPLDSGQFPFRGRPNDAPDTHARQASYESRVTRSGYGAVATSPHRADKPRAAMSDSVKTAAHLILG